MTTGKPALVELPLGAIRPEGWLRRQLQLQADGITGKLDEVWEDVGASNAWLGGSGDDWERGPYYLDGLLPLAHVLDDGALKTKAEKWVEAILGSQRADGQFGPTTNDDWWPRMVALKVLTQHADATDDVRVAPFLARYFRYQARALPDRPIFSWGRARGADNVLSVMWLFDRTGEDWLLDLARLLLEQTADWATFILRQLPPGVAPDFKLLTHGPNIAMGLKTPAACYLVDGDQRHKEETLAMFEALERLHGLVHGVFSGDEWLAGRDPVHGVETCQVVELMFTVEQLARIFGDRRFGDYLEQIAFNLLAAANDPRMLAHQYHQQANQVLVTVAQREWSFSGDDANIFGLEPHYGCCTANLHQGWPKFVRSLWMLGEGDTLTAVAYAPCVVDVTVRGTAVRLAVDTSYPFDEAVCLTVDVPVPTTLALRLRVPGWCERPTLTVAGSRVETAVAQDGYLTVDRIWAPGDTVILSFPMPLRLVPRDRGAVGLRMGPLVMVLGVPETWHAVTDAPGLGEWEITPRGTWNVGLWVDPPERVQSWRITHRPVGDVPFDWRQPPVEVRALGASIPAWKLVDNSAGALPQSPVPSPLPMDQRRLVPYGSARIRIAEFPTVSPATGSTADAWTNGLEWSTAESDADRAKASVRSTYPT